MSIKIPVETVSNKDLTIVPFSDPKAQKFFDSLMTETLAPSFDVIRRCAEYGAVAIAVHELLPDHETAARSLGWNGKDKVFRLSKGARRLFADNLESIGDRVAAAWLRRESSDPRVFAFCHGGTLLLNYSHSRAKWSLEPGSTMGDRINN